MNTKQDKPTLDQYGSASDFMVALHNWENDQTPHVQSHIEGEGYTKGEWELSPFKAGMVGQRYDNPLQSNTICQVFGSTPQANAQRIVKAVNCHDELVNTLKKWAEWFESPEIEANWSAANSIYLQTKDALNKIL